MTTRSATGVAGTPGSRRHDAVLLGIACLAQFMVILDVSVVNVALPSIGHQLHFGATSLQWVVDAYILTYAGFLLLGGRVSDYVGRRHAYLTGMGLFVAASVVGGAAQNALWLTVARAAQGIGGAILAPSTLAIVVTTFTGRRLTRAVGVWAAITSLGGPVGTVVGGLVTAELGWRWILFINVPMGIVAGAAGVAVLRNRPRSERTRRLDIPGALTVTVGLAVLAYAIVSTDRYSWGSIRTLVLLALCALLFGGFVVVQRRSASPLVPFRLLRSRWVAGADTTILFVGAWSFPPWYFFSLYLQQAVGYSALRTGVAFFPLLGSLSVGTQVSTRVLMPRLGMRRTIQVASVPALAGFLWLSRLGPTGGYWAGLFGGAMLMGFAYGIVVTQLIAAATGAVDPADAGLASGLLNTSRQVGGSIGLAAMVTVAAARTAAVLGGGVHHTSAERAAALTVGYDRAFLVCAALTVVAVAVSFVLPATLPRTQPEPRTATPAPELDASVATETPGA